MSRQLVTNISQSSHTGILVDHVILKGAKPPTTEPIVEEYRKDGKLLYRHTHGLAVQEEWQNGSGKILEWHEIPSFHTLGQFYSVFGGQEFCELV